MFELHPTYKMLVLTLALVLHLSVAVIFVSNPASETTGLAKDFGSGGIEIALASIVEKPVTQTKKSEQKPIVEKTESAKISKDKPREEIIEQQTELEQRLPESENNVGGGVKLTQKNYLSTVLHLLESNKKYPYLAQRRHQEGIAVLYFEIDRQGEVLQFYIKESSGHEILDQEVLAMLERSKPFPAIPQDMSDDKLVLLLPIQFNLR